MLKDLWFSILGAEDYTPEKDKDRKYFRQAIDASTDITDSLREILIEDEQQIYDLSETSKDYGEEWIAYLEREYPEQLAAPTSSQDDFFIDLYNLAAQVIGAFDRVKAEQSSFDSPADLAKDIQKDIQDNAQDFFSDPKTLMVGAGLLIGLLLLKR